MPNQHSRSLHEVARPLRGASCCMIGCESPATCRPNTATSDLAKSKMLRCEEHNIQAKFAELLLRKQLHPPRRLCFASPHTFRRAFVLRNIFRKYTEENLLIGLCRGCHKRSHRVSFERLLILLKCCRATAESGQIAAVQRRCLKFVVWHRLQ